MTVNLTEQRVKCIGEGQNGCVWVEAMIHGVTKGDAFFSPALLPFRKVMPSIVTDAPRTTKILSAFPQSIVAVLFPKIYRDLSMTTPQYPDPLYRPGSICTVSPAEALATADSRVLDDPDPPTKISTAPAFLTDARANQASRLSHCKCIITGEAQARPVVSRRLYFLFEHNRV